MCALSSLSRYTVRQSLAASTDDVCGFIFFLKLVKIIVCTYMYVQKVHWDMIFFFLTCLAEKYQKQSWCVLFPDKQALWPSWFPSLFLLLKNIMAICCFPTLSFPRGWVAATYQMKAVSKVGSGFCFALAGEQLSASWVLLL